MSAFADESAGTAPSLINSCILRMHSAQVPIVGGRSFLFVECFGSELQPAALDLVNTLNSTRQVLLQQSSQDSYDYLHFISQLDMYRERLAVLLESLSCQSVVNLHTALQFVWRGCLGDPPSAMHAPKSEIIYEIIMVLWCSIMLRFRQGVSTVETGGTPKEAAKLFLEAASLSQYLAEDTLPRWVNNRYMDIFPEANVHVAAGFTKVCLTAASQCVVAQAFATQSPEMLSKLCSAVSASADEAITSFSRAGDIFKALDKNLLAYLSFVREFFSALAFYNAGKVAEKGARAVAFFGTAVGVLRQQGKAGDTVVHNPLARGLPKLVGTYSTCVSAIGTLLADLQELHETAVRENNMIYYEATLHHIDMPEPRFLAAVKKYVAMPIDGIVDFSKPVPAPTGAHASASAPVSVSVSRASSTGSTTSVGSAPAAVTLSDEEMARQLQEQFDNE